MRSAKARSTLQLQPTWHPTSCSRLGIVPAAAGLASCKLIPAWRYASFNQLNILQASTGSALGQLRLTGHRASCQLALYQLIPPMGKGIGANRMKGLENCIVLYCIAIHTSPCSMQLRATKRKLRDNSEPTRRPLTEQSVHAQWIPSALRALQRPLKGCSETTQEIALQRIFRRRSELSRDHPEITQRTHRIIQTNSSVNATMTLADYPAIFMVFVC